MKKSQLRSLVRKAITEVISEATQKSTIDYKNPSMPDKILDLDPSDTATIDKLKRDPDVASANIGVKKIKEMARPRIAYKLGDDYEDKLDQLPYATSPKRMAWINGIINFVAERETATIPEIATERFNLPQQRIAGYVVDLMRLGVLVPAEEGVVPQAMRNTPVVGGEEGDEGEEEIPTDSRDVADLFIGNVDPKSLYLGRQSAGEEQPSEEEPEMGNLEPLQVTGTRMSDEDYAAFIKYDELKQRLSATKSNLLKTKKAGRSSDDLKDISSSNEVARLTKLKSSLEDRIKELVQNSPYLQAKLEKEVSAPEIPSVDDLEDKEPIDEYMMNKWQYYAGIKK